jgi:hypothetical protein
MGKTYRRNSDFKFNSKKTKNVPKKLKHQKKREKKIITVEEIDNEY